MKHIDVQTFDRIGTVWFGEEDGLLTDLSFSPLSGGERKITPLLQMVQTQLEEYLSGKRKEFDLPLLLPEKGFCGEVYSSLMKIPYGETATYSMIAKEIGNPKAARAVGAACAKNPILIVIPCHRIVGANGNPTGYVGGIDKKIALLTLEGLNNM